jgi:deaminated glutathione amidase
MTMLKAAAIQMRSGVEPAANAAALRNLVREAASAGAKYVQTPEMTGMVERDRRALFSRLKPEQSDAIVAAARELALAHSIHLHIGSTAILRPDGKVANRAFLFAPNGDLVTTYDKIHMFDADLDKGESWRESSTYTPGEKAVTADLPFGSLGFAICYDLRFPELFRAEAMAGAQILTAPAAFTKQTGEAHWHVLLRARAIENGAFLVSAAQAGLHEDGRETFGHSMIVDPWGRIIAEALTDEPQVISAEIDISEVGAARKKIPNLNNARAFSVMNVSISPEKGGRAA